MDKGETFLWADKMTTIGYNSWYFSYTKRVDVWRSSSCFWILCTNG